MRYEQQKSCDKSKFEEKLTYIVSKTGLTRKLIAQKIGIEQTSLSHAIKGPKSEQMEASIGLLYELVSGSAPNIRQDCISHLNAFLAQNAGDPVKLGWVLVELRKQFPVRIELNSDEVSTVISAAIDRSKAVKVSRRKDAIGEPNGGRPVQLPGASQESNTAQTAVDPDLKK
jgi:hypothetical protein